MTLRVTAVDLETGETQTGVVPNGDYMLLLTEPANADIQVHANGTHVITVKGRTAPSGEGKTDG